MNNPYDDQSRQHEVGDPPMPTRAELAAALDASAADLAAARTTPLGPVLARMRAAADGLRQGSAARATNAKPSV